MPLQAPEETCSRVMRETQPTDYQAPESSSGEEPPLKKNQNLHTTLYTNRYPAPWGLEEHTVASGGGGGVRLLGARPPVMEPRGVDVERRLRRRPEAARNKKDAAVSRRAEPLLTPGHLLPAAPPLM